MRAGDGSTSGSSSDMLERIRRAEELIAEEKCNASDELTRKKIVRHNYALLSIITALFIASCIYNCIELRRMNRSTPVSTERKTEDVNTHMFLVSLKIEEYKREYGRYPVSLEKDLEDEEVQYTLYEDGAYALPYQLGDSVLTYRSTDDPTKLLCSELLDGVMVIVERRADNEK